LTPRETTTVSFAARVKALPATRLRAAHEP
jgi:hypothetical protein